ncbi:MAG: dockerin type I repeat-containing protein [Ruminococcus sp.]|nr:dockerin type I repeat-containing protein [Ruminococcus sp.]
MKQYTLKKFLASMSSLCVMASALPMSPLAQTAAAESDIMYGDVTGDGQITIDDAVKILSYVSNNEKYPLSEEQLDAADVYARGDGLSNMDALAVQKYISQVLPELPESYSPSSSSDDDTQSNITLHSPAVHRNHN